MEKVVNRLKDNPVVFFILNGLLYIFYGLLIGLAVLPSAALLLGLYRWGIITLTGGGVILGCLGVGLSVYLFFVSGLLVIALAERLLTLGIRPGKYSIGSPTFLRWLIYAGVHTLGLYMIFPYVVGSGFMGLYYNIVGCKMGRDCFINTAGLHDLYLLEMGDNVFVGGKSDITCHLFEGDHLLLAPIKIGSDVMIGSNCYVMPGVTIEDRCDIGAGSLIRKNETVKSGTLLAPLPAMPARQMLTLMRTARGGRRLGQK